jgi:CDP-paratose 2-epimerase
VETNRIGDHIWWISNVRKFKAHYPQWELTYSVQDILEQMFTHNIGRWS